MARFKYKAVMATGGVYEKIGEAETITQLARDLKEQGDTLVCATPIVHKEWYRRINVDIGGIKLVEKISFAKNLAAMVDAGLTVSRGIAIMEHQTASKKFRDILSQIGGEIQKGTAFSQAVAKFPEVFSSLFVGMVRAGEESGKLGDSLRTVAEHMDRSFALRRRIRGALMYPTIILILMVIIGIAMMIYVVPTLTATFKEMNADLPASTELIVKISDGLVAHPILYTLGIVLVIGLIVLGLRTKQGKRGFEFALMHLPVIKVITQQTNSARMSRTLSSLLSSGVDVVSALNITGEVLQNSYYKEVLEVAETDVQKGTTISNVFERYQKIYPPMVTEMVAVGEETGKLPDMLLQIATFFEAEVDQKTKDLSTIIEPILMVVIGAAVGFFAVSMIMPIYSISSSI